MPGRSPRETFYVTTPIYYVNDVPHIGHTYTTVVADVIARFQRMAGRTVRFVTGTDEHGQHVERAALRQGIKPKELADRVVKRYHAIWKKLGMTHDDFIRTTDDRHARSVLKVFERIKAKGDIYLGKYKGMYCTGCEAFYPESQIKDGICPELGHPVEPLEEESYFFRLSKYQEPLLKLYSERPEFILPEIRRNEVTRFVEMGLRDLSISRTAFSWGIRYPDDPRHIFYVWFDALCNYLSALGYAEESENFDRFWPADIHLVGKDIIRFHAVYWPAFLMSAGLPLPATVWGHGWWLRAEGKMSKSTGNVVDPMPLIDTFGADPLRYFLMREMAFGQDAQFSEEGLIDRINNDLANDLGNLASRLLRLIESSCDGTIPPLPKPDDGDLPDDLFQLRRRALESLEICRNGYAECRFHEGLASLWELVSEANRHLVRWEPWSLAKDPSRRGLMEAVLREAAEALAGVAVAISPVMPSASEDLWRRLGGPGTSGEHDLFRRPPNQRWGILDGGRKVERGASLFPRIDKKAYFKETPMEPSTPTPTPPAGAPKEGPQAGQEDQISIEEFLKVRLRTAKVVSAERVQGADKLLKLTVDVGSDVRTIVAGIAKQYEPESLVGKTMIVVVNLKPAKLRGVESRGMLLAADVGGEPIVATFERELPPGSVVR
jgi:methionyl-tRNA synthetase